MKFLIKYDRIIRKDQLKKYEIYIIEDVLLARRNLILKLSSADELFSREDRIGVMMHVRPFYIVYSTTERRDRAATKPMAAERSTMMIASSLGESRGWRQCTTDVHVSMRA